MSEGKEISPEVTGAYYPVLINQEKKFFTAITDAHGNKIALGTEIGGAESFTDENEDCVAVGKDTGIVVAAVS